MGASVHVAIRRNGETVDAVVDEGPGISARDQARVFERFWRDNPSCVRRTGGIVDAFTGSSQGVLAGLLGLVATGGAAVCGVLALRSLR